MRGPPGPCTKEACIRRLHVFFGPAVARPSAFSPPAVCPASCPSGFLWGGVAPAPAKTAKTRNAATSVGTLVLPIKSS